MKYRMSLSAQLLRSSRFGIKPSHVAQHAISELLMRFPCKKAPFGCFETFLQVFNKI